MAYWTSAIIIKTHLQNPTIAPYDFSNAPLILSAYAESFLPHRLIVPDSEKVKQVLHSVPIHDTPILLAGTWTNLSFTDIVKHSVFSCQDERLFTNYIENVDFVIDHTLGRIRPIPGSSILIGVPIQAWYYHFTIYIKNTDYEIDNDTGAVNRKAGGAIADFSEVYVDYQVSSAIIEDALIDECIKEAESQIVMNLAEEYSTASTDQDIITATTNLTLAMIARSQAAAILQDSQITEPSNRATRWTALSLSWEQEAWQLLSPFMTQTKPHAAIRINNPQQSE